MKDKIIAESVSLLVEGGLPAWSIERVARRAGCAKALVIHYFGTRPQLLAVSGREIGRRRHADRMAALGWEGTEGLDRLWAVIADHARTGLAGAAILLAAHGFVTAGDSDATDLHRAALECLGIGAEALADPIAMAALLEGIELQLIRGVDHRRAKTSYDQLWAAMIYGS